MAAIYVARSAKLGKWASDVGLSKHVYKFGYSDEDVNELVARGWAGEDDWQLVKSVTVDGADETQLIERIARREKIVDPRYYPRIRDATGLFKVDPAHVENHILVARALAGEAERIALKLKPADFAVYLIDVVRRWVVVQFEILRLLALSQRHAMFQTWPLSALNVPAIPSS
ncbi:MAG: hypothetical protein ACREEL_04580 [Stellaceae bacterium]